MPARELGEHRWHRPGRDADGGVEAMPLGDGRVALRQPADPDGPALVFTRQEFAAFLRGVKQGAADFLLDPGPEPGTGCAQPPSTCARS